VLGEADELGNATGVENGDEALNTGRGDDGEDDE